MNSLRNFWKLNERLEFSGIPKSNGSPSRNAGESIMLSNNIGSKADLNAEIQNGTFQLRKTNGIQNDCSAPKF